MAFRSKVTSKLGRLGSIVGKVNGAFSNVQKLDQDVTFDFTQKNLDTINLKPKAHPSHLFQRSNLEAYTSKLTVMFCDLVGSTALSEQLAPCEYLTVIRSYQELCTLVIRNFQGYIAQPLGDGLLVYFGYPHVQPDDATRCVKAGLGVLIAMQQLNLILREKLQLQLAARVGIATGEVLMGQVGVGNKSEWLAIGLIPNIAARLQSLATSNSVVLCPTTHKLVSECVENCQSLGQRSLKGISQPMEVYQVSV